MKRTSTAILFAGLLTGAWAQLDCDSIIHAAFTPMVQGNVVVFNNSSTSLFPQATTFKWNFGDGSTTTGHTVTHEYDEPGTYWACLYAIVENCVDSVCHEVVIAGGDPCDALDDVSTTVTANGNGVSYSYANVPEDAYAVWYFGDGTTSDAQQGFHPYQQPGAYTVCLWTWFMVPGTADTCSREVCHQVVVQGNGSPCDQLNPDFNVSTQGPIAHFDNALSSNNFSYQWYFGDGTTDFGPDPVHTYPGPGSYHACLVMWTWDPGTQDTCFAEHCEWVTIAGNPNPCDSLSAGFWYGSNGGNPLSIFYSATMPGGAGTHWLWSFGDGTYSDNGPQGTHIYGSPGTYEMCLTLWQWIPGTQDTCSTTHCELVTVGGASPCDSLSADFVVTTQGPLAVFNAFGGTAVSYHWNFGDGTVGDGPSPVHTYPGSGTYHACLVTWTWDPQTQDTCFADHCEWVTIGQGTGCDSLFACFQWGTQQQYVQFYNCSSFAGSELDYWWSFGDGTYSDAEQPSHAYPGPGSYNVCLTASAGSGPDSCASSVCNTVVIQGNGGPCDSLSADFVVTGIETQAVFNSFGGTAIGYHWTFGDGQQSFIPDPVHNYPGPGTYHACLVTWTWDPQTQDTCYAEHCQWLTVGGGAPCDSLYACYQTGQQQQVVQFYNCSGGTSGDLYYQWSFGDGTYSDAYQPIHTYPGPGTYTACLTVTALNSPDSCSDSVCQTIVIQGGGSPCDNINANFTTTFNGLYAMFHNTVVSNQYSYQWNFGDGTQGFGPNPGHDYLLPGEYHVCLEMWGWNPETQDSCFAEHCAWINVQGGNNPCDSLYACFQTGVQQQVVQFFNCSGGTNNDLHYFWTFGDGTTSDAYQPTHTYPGPGAYTICLTVTAMNSPDSCSDSVCQTLVIEGGGSPCDNINANFSTTFNGLYAMFHNTVVSNQYSYQWNFGDGTQGFGPNPGHDYLLPGEYHVCLVMWGWNPETQDSCFAEHCAWINVQGGNNPCDSLYACFQTGVQQQVVQFFNCSGGTNNDLHYFWTFGDGTTSDAYQPTHTYPGPGTYTVCLTVTAMNSPDSCSDTVCNTVVIQGGGSPCDQLNAEFTASTSGLTLAVTAGNNPPGTSYQWFFGDGYDGFGSSATHTYVGPGSYHVCLVVGSYDPMTQDSCFQDHCTWINIGGGGSPCDSLWNASFEFGNQGSVFTFYNTSSTQGTEVQTTWNFGDGTDGEGSQLVHTYPQAGPYTVCMTITGIAPGTNDTCSVTICQTVEVVMGLEELQSAPISAWPQPFDDVLTLDGAALQGSLTFTVLDMTGRLVDQRTMVAAGRITLDLGHLTTGSYALRVHGKNIDQTLRLIKH